MYHTAYLIVICNKADNSIVNACIWSSPEWQQSRCLPEHHTYVAYALSAESFADGIERITEVVKDERSRYHYLLPYLNLDGFE